MIRIIFVGSREEDFISILTDTITREPVLDFERYSSIIGMIIVRSEPKFSVGIYGERGAGKTTLMRMIEKEINKDNEILTLWFDAWRASVGEEPVLIHFMRSLQLLLDTSPYRKITKRDMLKRGVERSATAFKESATISLGIKDILPENTRLGENYLPPTSTYHIVATHLENELAKLYFENPRFRIVVFVDNLDKCGPKKLLEILELKSFFDIRGLIFVIGLDNKKVSTLLDELLSKEIGITGKQYLKDLIQVALVLPEQNPRDLHVTIQALLAKLDSKHASILSENIPLIEKAARSKSKDVIRFLNSFILASAIFTFEIDSLKMLLAVQVLKVRWKDFYLLLSSRRDFRELTRRCVKMSKLERDRTLKEFEIQYHQDSDPERMILPYKQDEELWDFFDGQGGYLLELAEQDWNRFRKAADLTLE